MKDITELNEAYTLSKSVKAILMKMLDENTTDAEENACMYYALIHICDSVIFNQKAAIEKLSLSKIG